MIDWWAWRRCEFLKLAMKDVIGVDTIWREGIALYDSVTLRRLQSGGWDWAGWT